MVSSNKLTILGAGAWGTALCNLAQNNQHQVKIWSRRHGLELADCITHTEIVISAIAMKGVTPVIERLKQVQLPAATIIVTATKGLDSQTRCTPSQLWQEAFPHLPVVVLSGPNLSKEIQQGLPAATVVAGEKLEAAKTVQQIFASPRFRVYINQDPLGTELGGTLKNIMAIAAGVCDGLELGTNAKAGLLTRALPEMIRVGTSLGAKIETFFGLSGLGDLLATCNSPLSRNYQVGYQLAKGESLQDILNQIEGTAEGVNTTGVLIDLAQEKDLSVPISQEVYRLLQGETTPQQAVEALMRRQPKPEFDHLTCDFEYSG